ncbi:aminodeoxychorismate synthase component I [Acidipila sp. EB88]|uniref:aminodeoxychorismate synthase component I n=1 Tax=Acidipila sp. EB88 TaxID=2305226 RepID=UPI0013152D87|nr:aminodeoxychorismate synthase component I [Acidipila sp. EB88]
MMERFREIAARERGAILLEAAREADVVTAGSAAAAGGLRESLFFREPVEWLEVWRLEELPALFARLEAANADGLWAAGYLAYECGYHWEPTATVASGSEPVGDGLPLAAFGLYRQPARFVGEALPAGDGGEHARLQRFVPFSMDEAAFAGKVEQVQRWIAAGDTYQVNLTGQAEAEWHGGVTPLFRHMMEAQPVRFGALLHGGTHQRPWWVLSASPELFFELRKRRIRVRPMKGTARRGADAAEDQALAAELAADPKNRAENIMIVDLLRSDLGRVAETGSVRVERLFEVEQFASLLQMSSEVSATLRPEVDKYGLFRALFPSGSIVGAPKVRTMQLIQELEQASRGVYTGAIGFFAPDGDAVFSVAIRTAVVRDGAFRMGLGAGITWDSEAGAEYRECLLKGAFLRGVSESGVGGSVEPGRGLARAVTAGRMAEDAGWIEGLIETMRWEAGACALWPLHLARLERSARRLGLRFDQERVEQAVLAEAAALSCDVAWRLRLVLAADGGLRLSHAALEAGEEGQLRLMLWPQRVDSADPLLRHKTTRRGLYDAALAGAREAGCVDAVLVNERGEVCEGAIHNVFVRHGSLWRTPPVEAGVLPGVFREHLLRTMPGIREERFGVEALRAADEIWITNAVRGVRVAVFAG